MPRPREADTLDAMKETLSLCLHPSVVKRALKYAIIVGSILIAINHSDVLFSGDVPPGRWARMGLTVVVPYVVSTLSSAGAMREAARARVSSHPHAQLPS